MLIKIYAKKRLIVGLLLMFFISSISSATQLSNNNISTNDELFSEPHTCRDIIYVDDDNKYPPWDGSINHPYQCINDAIDFGHGDTIYVFNGTYKENIELHEKKPLIGENRNSTIIDGGRKGSVIKIRMNNQVISGFTIRNSGRNTYDSGIKVIVDYQETLIIKNNRGL